MALSSTMPGVADSAADLNRVTLGRQIAEAIRADILFGRIPAGTRLGQQQLCDRFGTSRMPIRDALRQLAYEAFLTSDGRGHSVVAQMSRRDIEDTFVVEAMLHGLAARRVTERVEPEQLAELEALHWEMGAACDEGEMHRFAELNWRFHRRINQLADSPKLVAALKTLAMILPRDFVVEIPEWAAEAHAEHAAIITAMLAGDGEAVEEMVRRHVSAAGSGLVQYLEDHGVDLE